MQGRAGQGRGCLADADVLGHAARGGAVAEAQLVQQHLALQQLLPGERGGVNSAR